MEHERTPFTRLTWALMILWINGGIISLLMMQKGDMVRWLNTLHSPTGDALMVAWTFLGDGLMFAVALVFLVLLVRVYHVLPLLFAALVQTILVHLGKRVIFKGSPRPKAYFGEDFPLHYVEGVKVHLFNSFPSGHTATAFTLALLVMLLHRKHWSTILAFVLAAGAGISRMYLVLHFWQDVIAGSIVALLSVLLTWLVWYRSEPGWARKGLWGHKLIGG